jgi:hypothetical protein
MLVTQRKRASPICANNRPLCMQASAACCEAMVRDGGINEVLLAVAPYHREKQPLKDKDEEEYVLELCNVLAACVVDGAVRARFVEDEGVELMLLVLKGRQFYRTGVLKARTPPSHCCCMCSCVPARSLRPTVGHVCRVASVSCLHALQLMRVCGTAFARTAQVLVCATTDFQRAVDRVIANKAGLPVLFGLFMGKSKTRGVKAGSDDARQQLESTCSMIANLLHYSQKRCACFELWCSQTCRSAHMRARFASTCLSQHTKMYLHLRKTSARACRATRERVAAKFVENEFEKADRLMELFFEYHGRWQRALARLKAAAEGVDEETVDAALQGAGQFVLRQVRRSGGCARACW